MRATWCRFLLGLAVVTIWPLLCCTAADKPRLIVLTDIGADPDDQQSMIRLMLYANEFDIDGLIASASGTPGELKRAIVRPDLIREIVEAYGKVRERLVSHADGYPSAATLLDRIKSGNPQRGVEHLGDREDTEGSRWIISVVDWPDARPVNISIWGGSTELAQALWRVQHDRSPAEFHAFVRKLRVYAVTHQDNTGPWIVQDFPELFYVLGHEPEGHDKREAVFRGMYLGGDQSLTSGQWIDSHVCTGHGPLGEIYPRKTWTAPNPYSALKEGDTPSWFYFLPNGLSDPDHPQWGGWGGRFAQQRDRLFNDAIDHVGQAADARATVWRWRPAFQNDFQARMDWCVRPYAEANHAPTITCNGEPGSRILHLTARPGQSVKLNAAGSRDPDGNHLACRWWVYPEAGTYPKLISIDDADRSEARLTVPEDAQGKQLHVILEVTDDGQPPLTSYRRVVVDVSGER